MEIKKIISFTELFPELFGGEGVVVLDGINTIIAIFVFQVFSIDYSVNALISVKLLWIYNIFPKADLVYSSRLLSSP